MSSVTQPLDLPSWQRKFYAGERLKAEIELYGALAQPGLFTR